MYVYTGAVESLKKNDSDSDFKNAKFNFFRFFFTHCADFRIFPEY